MHSRVGEPNTTVDVMMVLAHAQDGDPELGHFTRSSEQWTLTISCTYGILYSVAKNG